MGRAWKALGAPLLKVMFLTGMCCIAAIAHAGLPETPRPRQLTVADGLPSNRINGITEDRLGYLWIATSDGLVRYDGIDFRVWRVEQGLHDNFVWTVHVDSKNRVWIGTQHAGLAMLDVERRQFRYYSRDNTPVMASDDVWSVASTPDGTTWFGTADSGLYRMAPGGRITRYMPRAGDPRSLPDASVGQLAVAGDGTLWIGTKGGAARWTGRDFERVPTGALNSLDVNGLTIESDGTVWIGTPGGVSVRRPNGSYSRAPWADQGMTDKILHVLQRDRSGQYWFDIPAGLGRDEEGQVTPVPLYSAEANGLVRPSWVGAYEDREGGLWFVSYNNGLWHLPANWRRFSVLTRHADAPGSIANAHVRGIAPSTSGDIWLVGTGGVLDRLDPETGQVAHVRRNVGDGFVLTDVFEDQGGQVWVSYNNGLVRVDPASDRLSRWTPNDQTDAALPGVAHFAQTSDQTLWLATERGGVQARDETGHAVVSLALGYGGLPADLSIEQIQLAPDGGIWLAGSHGLLMWNAGRKRFEHVPGAPQNYVYGFAMGEHEKVWLARFGGVEVYRWDGAMLRFEESVDTRRGFPALAPSGLALDATGKVWLTSVRGLIRVDPDDRSVRVYGVRDGLPGQEFEDFPVLRPSDGRILAGGTEGLVLFDPAVANRASPVPPLIVESIEVRRGDANISFAPDEAISIRHGDRDLRIVARLLSFNDARNHSYRFRLAGYDTDWVDVGSSGQRIFSQLRPGKYRLEIQARAADNVWSKVKTVAFEVMPPWWRTWWAIAAFASLAALLFWSLANAYRDRLKRRHAWQLAQQQRELAEQASLAKTRFLAMLGHEVRTPMTGVLGMSELLLGTPLNPQQRGYVGAIRGAGEHLLRLVNDALDLARIESGKLELADEAFDLHALMEELAALIGPLARQRGLVFEMAIGEDSPRQLRGDAARVRQILLNLLGNAVKFTERGRISLSVSMSPEGVCFEVADTGPGLNAEQKARLFRRFEQAEGARTRARYGGSGLGLAISQELAAAMSGSIDVDSTPGEGTRFRVRLPLPEPLQPAQRDDDMSQPQPNSYRSLSLLLVEDDPTVADVLTGLLRLQGHHVVHVPHGLSALAAVAVSPFDAALLDLDLPGMDGLALARQLRIQGFARPLIAITARADAGAEPDAMEAGFDYFIRKPMTLKMLEALLQRIDPAAGDRALAESTELGQEEPV
jgi:signal transduction histidine kinase/ligand-binding sensor domain-containing protein/CheY-like chemotaxis protein